MSDQMSASTIDINATADRVWRALTDPGLVKQWQYGSTLITDWIVGASIRYVAEWEGETVEQWGTILEFRPTTLIRYSLFAPRPDLEDQPENYFTMSYSLEEIDGVTRLTVSQHDPRARSTSHTGDEDVENPILQALKDLVESSTTR
jgi:uncharacterized protein YndB with AHSA1/START domain